MEINNQKWKLITRNGFLYDDFYRKKRKTPKSLASWDISVNFQTVNRYIFCKLLSIFKTFLILDFAVTTTSQFLRTLPNFKAKTKRGNV